MDEQNLDAKSWESFPLNSSISFCFHNVSLTGLRIWQLSMNGVSFVSLWVWGFQWGAFCYYE
jgi:hypothetical protein